MPKGYWIPQIDVSNPEGYKAYMAATPPAHEKYRGNALVRGGKSEVVEGRARSRNVLREFPDYATALACYRSDEYQRAKPLRLPHSQSISSSSKATTARSRPPHGRAARRRGQQGLLDRPHRCDRCRGYKPYMVADQAPFGAFGGRYLVRGGKQETPEGKSRSRTVVLEFPSYEAALACYRSPGYQAAKKLRDGKGDFDLVIVEGYDGPKF